MNLFRRITALAPPVLGLLFAAGAYATPILESGSTSAFGSYSGFVAPNSNTTSAAQFNQAAVDAAIQANCPLTYTCTGSTLTEIDFTLTANINASVTVQNTSGSQGYVGPIGGRAGDNGSWNGNTGAGTGNTTGVAVDQSTNVTLVDPNNNDVVVVVPTFNQPTSNQYASACLGGGNVTSSNYINCLILPATSSTTFTGTGTDTQTGSLFSSDAGWALEMSPYTSGGGLGTVLFGLNSDGSTNNGSLRSGTTVPANSATVQGLVNGLEVTYDYTYSETAPSTGTPEPATMLLMGGALLGLGLYRRKSRMS